MYDNKGSGKLFKKYCVESGRKTFCRWFNSSCIYLNEGENKKEREEPFKEQH